MPLITDVVVLEPALTPIADKFKSEAITAALIKNFELTAGTQALDIKSIYADVKNSGGREAGALTAAAFLEKFVGDVPWAHLDIAGPMASDADDGWLSKGATGFGTRLLIELASTFSAVTK